MSRASYPRAERVRAAIKRVVGEEIERLKDPGVGFVTVTDVTITPDLRHAKVFYTVFGDEPQRAATRDGLARAASHLRGAVAHEVRLRFTPTLEFLEDPVPERTRRIETILQEIHHSTSEEEEGRS